MPHFYETLKQKEIDFECEVTKLKSIVFGEEEDFSYRYRSLAEYIDQSYFRSAKITCNYMHFNQYINDAGKAAKTKSEYFIYFCEALLSIIWQAPQSNFDDTTPFYRTFRDINRVINYDLSKCNLRVELIKDDQLGDVAIIIPRNQLLENILSASKDQSLNSHLIEYCSSHTEGNVVRKAELLKLIAGDVEKTTKDATLKALNERLYKDTDFLFNNLDLRHNQAVKDPRFYNETLPKREKWLDLTYREVLMVLASEIEQKDHVAIKELKRKVNGGSN